VLRLGSPLSRRCCSFPAQFARRLKPMDLAGWPDHKSGVWRLCFAALALWLWQAACAAIRRWGPEDANLRLFAAVLGHISGR